MSQAHVEIAKRGIDAYNRRDVDAFADLTTPGYEWFPALAIVEGGGFRGREGIETYFEDMRNHWEEVRVFTDELRDLGDRVLLLGRVQGRGRGSGLQVDSPLGVVFDFHGDKI